MDSQEFKMPWRSKIICLNFAQITTTTIKSYLQFFCLGSSIPEGLVLFIGLLSFPGGSEGKASAYNVGDLGSIPGSGRSPGEGNSNPL